MADAVTTPTALLATQVYVPTLLPVAEETFKAPPTVARADPWNCQVMRGAGLPEAEQVKMAG